MISLLRHAKPGHPSLESSAIAGKQALYQLLGTVHEKWVKKRGNRVKKAKTGDKRAGDMLVQRAVLKWGSAIVLAYLAAFYGVDAVVRIISRHPIQTPVSLGLAILTVILSTRALWFSAKWSWPLSLIAVGGLAINWHPLILLMLLMGLATLAALRWYRPGSRTVLARRLLAPWPVALDLPDRFLHLHVLGPTGSGKSSSVLMPLIAQDLVKGYGVLVLEPKGDLTKAAYHRALQANRAIICFNPLDPDCPHLNPLSGPSDAAAEGLAGCLDQLSAGSHPYYAVSSRVQLLHAVRVIKTCLGNDADIGHVLEFFRNTALQKKMVVQSQDPAAQAYFQEQWARTASQSREDRQGLLNRLELLWANPSIRRVLSAPHDFTWDEVLRDRWVVLAGLSLAELGDSARALGNLLWHGMAQSAYRRNPTTAHPPFFAYLDEFYQWVSDDLGDFLALARGYSVGLTLAHQDLGQLSKPLQQAVIANARHRVILPGSAAEDVHLFRRQAEPYGIEERLRYLKRGRAVIQTTQGGRLKRPWVVRLAHHPLGEVSSSGS